MERQTVPQEGQHSRLRTTSPWKIAAKNLEGQPPTFLVPQPMIAMPGESFIKLPCTEFRVIDDSGATAEHPEICHSWIPVNKNESQPTFRVRQAPCGLRDVWPSGCLPLFAFYHRLIMHSLFSSFYVDRKLNPMQ